MEKHAIHERLLRDGWPEVLSIVSRREQETVDLDFKSKSDPAHGALDRKDREILAQTLSALANSIGGAVIYGIDCRVNDDGVDAAADIKAIQGIRRFASEVTANIANLVLPRLESVAVDLIEKPGAPDTGILVISVERSERRPHRSEAAGDKRYYKRSGSNTVQMEHFDVEDAFHRQSVAKLEFDTPTPFEGGSSNNTHHYYLAFFLRNVSNVTAKFPFVEVERLQGGVIWQYGIDGNGTFPLKPMPTSRLRWFGGDANIVIHPGQAIDVFRLVFHVQRPSREINSSAQHATWPEGFIPIATASLELSLRIACENAALMRQTFQYSGAELADLLKV